MFNDPVNLVDPWGENPAIIIALWIIGLSEYANAPAVGDDIRQGLTPASILLPLPAIGKGKFCPSSAGKGLGNPFRNKTADEIHEMFIKKGFEPRGPDPINGYGDYINPKTGRSYHIDPREYGRFREPNHIDVNRLNGSPLPKKKYIYLP